MLTRIITGVVLIAAALLWLFVADYPIFTMGALFIYMVAAYEMGPLLGYKSRIPFIVLAMICSSLLFFFAPPGEYIENGVPDLVRLSVALGFPVWIIMLPLLFKYPKDTAWHGNKVITTALGLLMLVPFLMGMITLRVTAYAADEMAGSYCLLAVMALVWCADSGAYFTGYFFGKTKMMPAVSPKKTIEGLLGGIVLALGAMLLFVHFDWFSVYGSNLTVIMVASVLTILFSVTGDLVESMLKRIVGIKDSGKIFPGHGGMLDRVDSQLAAIPVFLTSCWLLNGAW